METIVTENLGAEIEKIKNSMVPFTNFLQEIKDFRKNMHISAETHISPLNILSLAIKEEILRDMNSMISVSDEKILKVLEEGKENHKDCLEKVESCKNQIKNLDFEMKNFEELLSRHNSIQDLIRRDIDFCRKDLNDKVGYVDHIKLQKSLKNFTPLQETEQIKTKINDLAEKTQVENVKNDVKKIKNQILDLLTRTEAENLFKDIQANILEQFSETFLKKEIFENEIFGFNKKNLKFEEELKAFVKKSEMFHDGFKRKIGELFEIINNKPWENDLKNFIIKVDNSASKAELVSLKSEFFDGVSKLNKNQADLLKKQQTFEGIIERCDEILLDKASKDDIAYIVKQLEQKLSISAYKDFSESSNSNFSLLTSQVSQLSSYHESLKTTIFNISHKIDTIKKENADISNISESLQSITDVLDQKSDKSDIFIIYDIMGRKEELSKLAEIESLLRKQILMGFGIAQSLCRTLLYNGENPAYIKKQRFEIYKGLDDLQKWIKEGNGEPSTFLPVGRSNVNLKTEGLEESLFVHYGTARTSRRLRIGSQGTSPRYHKDELPSINF